MSKHPAKGFRPASPYHHGSRFQGGGFRIGAELLDLRSSQQETLALLAQELVRREEQAVATKRVGDLGWRRAPATPGEAVDDRTAFKSGGFRIPVDPSTRPQTAAGSSDLSRQPSRGLGPPSRPVSRGEFQLRDADLAARLAPSSSDSALGSLPLPAHQPEAPGGPFERVLRATRQCNMARTAAALHEQAVQSLIEDLAPDGKLVMTAKVGGQND